MIPKIIHYCWLSNDPIPEQFQHYMNGWKNMLNDYTFVKWDFNRFPKDKSDWVSEAYDNKKYAFAADYIRLFAVYNMGGIYMDMDIEVLKRFDDLLSAPYMFARERPDQQLIEAGCFGAEKGNLFLKQCLHYYEGRHFVNVDGEMDRRPLPAIMQEIMEEKGFMYHLYDYDYFTVKSYETGEIHPTSNSYAIHHFAGSWFSQEEKEISEMIQKYTKKTGIFVARNFAQLVVTTKYHGINGYLKLLKGKIQNRK